MSRIRSRGNKETELALMQIFRKFKITGWRRHVLIKFGVRNADCGVERGKFGIRSEEFGMGKKTSPSSRSSRDSLPSSASPRLRGSKGVRPDFVFQKLKLAVLVDGCFWHGCPRHSNLPVNNRAFWRRKLAVNRARDRRVDRALRSQGWRVVRLWEHELRHPEKCVEKLLGRKVPSSEIA